MIWLGTKRGYLSDWVTQRWVHFTGRRVNHASEPWLGGPIAPTTGIAPDYFAALASTEGLRLHQPATAAGVISDFSTLRGASFEPSHVHHCDGCGHDFTRRTLSARVAHVALISLIIVIALAVMASIGTLFLSSNR